MHNACDDDDDDDDIKAVSSDSTSVRSSPYSTQLNFFLSRNY